MLELLGRFELPTSSLPRSGLFVLPKTMAVNFCSSRLIRRSSIPLKNSGLGLNAFYRISFHFLPLLMTLYLLLFNCGDYRPGDVSDARSLSCFLVHPRKLPQSGPNWPCWRCRCPRLSCGEKVDTGFPAAS